MYHVMEVGVAWRCFGKKKLTYISKRTRHTTSMQLSLLTRVYHGRSLVFMGISKNVVNMILDLVAPSSLTVVSSVDVYRRL